MDRPPRTSVIERGKPVAGLRPRPEYDGRVAKLIELLGPGQDLAWELMLPTGQVYRSREPDPSEEPKDRSTLRLFMNDWKLLRGPVNQFTLARAYLQGDIDLEVDGDLAEVFVMRDRLSGGTTVTQAARLLGEFALVAPTRVNSGVIRRHYDIGEDFHLNFLDAKYHLYSTLIFDGDDTRSLEAAAEAKCERMRHALGLERGQHILDIGGGWGGLARYCGQLGVTVTSLTISEDSEAFIKTVIDAHNSESEVLRQDLLDHFAWERYDHVVIFGVIEHIPTYARFCERVWDALKPGGKLYMDASATKEKYAASAFTRRYTWTGAHSCLALPDMLQELILHGFHVEQVRNETDDYRLTMRKWAQKLDEADRDKHVTRNWGEHTYRAYRLFLWGGTHAFGSDRLQAYSVVAQRGPKPGPRPGKLRRAASFVASLR
jgi:cyclopropane-fatty-acyl-phospholipid synthase